MLPWLYKRSYVNCLYLRVLIVKCLAHIIVMQQHPTKVQIKHGLILSLWNYKQMPEFAFIIIKYSSGCQFLFLFLLIFLLLFLLLLFSIIFYQYRYKICVPVIAFYCGCAGSSGSPLKLQLPSTTAVHKARRPRMVGLNCFLRRISVADTAAPTTTSVKAF